MVDQSALKRAFADYARTTAGSYEIGEVLYRLTDQVVEVLDIDGAGVSIAEADGTLQFVTASDALTTRAEQHQIDAGEGPCHDAFLSGERVTVPDLARDERWPTFRPATLEVGMHAVAGIPMPLGEQRIGALNLYRRTPREWHADALDDAQLLADMATGYVLNTRALHEREQLAEQLQQALDSRVIIEQAKGVIAERHGIATPAAFEKLRRHARSSHEKVHDVARAVVDGRLQV
jgi:GAF domain-containing protein